MKIAILSDIHDQVWNLRAALHAIRGMQVGGVVCCGDVCSPFTAGMMVQASRDLQVPLALVWGNNDGDTARIMALRLKAENQHFEVYHELAELIAVGDRLLPTRSSAGQGGDRKLRIAVNHYPTIAEGLARSGRYDLVCFGHNHTPEVTLYGSTLAVNPGTLLGYRPNADRPGEDVAPTFALYDVASGQAQHYEVSAPWRDTGHPGTVQLCEL